MQTLRHVRLSLKKVGQRLQPYPKIPRFVHENVPYYCQWESDNGAADILSGKLAATDDPKWRQSGAETAEEYADWSWACCGMACLKMILAAVQDRVVPTVTLGKQCATYGGYTLPLKDSPGLYYRPFCTFVKKVYNLNAIPESLLTLHDIVRTLSHQGYVIVSVNPEIRWPNHQPKQKSGHLILLLGYDLDKKELYFHNPSGITPETQSYATISFHDFLKFFGHRGIIVHMRKG